MFTSERRQGATHIPMRGRVGWGYLVRFVAVLGLIGLVCLRPTLSHATGRIFWVRSPAPPSAILSDGTGVETMDWELSFDTTPDHYTIYITNPDGTVVYGPQTVSITGQSSPLTGQLTWTPPAGSMQGRYKATIDYYSVQGGSGFEDEGSTTFYVAAALGNLQILNYWDQDGDGDMPTASEPRLGAWNFTITDAFGTVYARSTDATGYINLTDVPAGNYHIVETLQDGWTNVLPLTEDVTVVNNQTAFSLFANRLPPTPTPTNTNTPVPTHTPTNTNTPPPGSTATNTPLPTDTPFPTNTPPPGSTNTPAPSNTPVRTPTPFHTTQPSQKTATPVPTQAGGGGTPTPTPTSFSGPLPKTGFGAIPGGPYLVIGLSILALGELGWIIALAAHRRRQRGE